MFAEVFRFELRYQLTRPSTWFYFLLVNVPLLVFSTGPFFNAARANGYPYNAPFAIASAAMIGGVFGLLMTAAIAGNAAARDVQLRLAPLLYTTPLSRAAYVGGRVLAAFTVVALLMLSVPVGQWLMLWLPGLDPALMAPFDPVRYLLVYGSLIVPTVFATGALMFAAALLARRAMAAFVVVAGLFVSAVFTNAILAQGRNLWTLAGYLDPLALTLMTEISRQRTALQKGQMLIGLEPAVLANRALWISVACVVLLGALARFSFTQAGTEGRPRRWGWRRAVADPLATPAAAVRQAPVALPPVHPRFDALAALRQALAIAGQSFREIVFARGFLIVAAVAVLVAVTGPQLMQHQGVPLVPVTGFIASALAGATDFFGFVAPLLSVVYAGQLVWRERDAGLAAITDAAPVRDWVPLAGKGLGLALVLSSWQALLMAAGLLTQLQMGYTQLQPLLWLQIVFGLGLSANLLFAALAIALHVAFNQKFAGLFAGLVALGLLLFAELLGVEHHLLVYGSDPGWSYSDMRGYGGTLTPVLWFRLYWAGWALLLLVGARLLWVRGVEQGLPQRWARVRARFNASVGTSAALAGLLVVGAGGWIFYNTNIRNAFVPAAARLAQAADYEKRYAATAAQPQPTIASRRLDVELYPARAQAAISGRDVFVNRTAGPIDTLHVEPSSSVETGVLRFDRPATLVADDKALRHRVVRLATPLAPGQSIAMAYTLQVGGHGFRNSGIDTAVTAGATYFDHEWLPVLGYQRGREINDDATRRDFGLPVRPEIPPLTDPAAPLDLRGAERVTVQATIGTDADQVAVGPGQLLAEWTRGGRHYFRYATAVPMRNEFAIYSARYAVREARWGDVAIRVYHHPAHVANVPRMIAGVQASLGYFSRAYGPYPAPQLTIAEVPGFDIGLHAYPTNVRYYEGFSLLDPANDPRDFDFPFAVTAHELAHQWWGNQVTPAEVAGAPFVAESLAWYSAFGAIADAKGEAHLQRMLEMMRDDFLGPRSRDGVPLLEAADRFTAYRVGPLSLVTLREAIGAQRVDLALRNFLRKHGEGKAPRPTSLELYAELKAVTPPAQRELLADLLERNTFWDVRTRKASARKLGNQWEVTLDLSALKESIDRQGRISPRPLHETLEIGVYGPANGNGPGKLLYLAPHHLRLGEQRITVTVPSQPATAGVDPRHVFIDLERRNNLAPVQVGAP